MTWMSEFKTFINRFNPKLNKMYMEERYELLPIKTTRDLIISDASKVSDGQAAIDGYREACKLNNEAQLLLRSAMDTSTDLSRVLDHSLGGRATVMEVNAEDVTSAYHQRMYLDERYGKKKGSTEEDDDKDKWEQMGRKKFQNLIKVLQDIEVLAAMMKIEHGIEYDDREIRRKFKMVIPKKFQEKVLSLGTRWYSMSRDGLVVELKMNYEAIKDKVKRNKRMNKKLSNRKGRKKKHYSSDYGSSSGSSDEDMSGDSSVEDISMMIKNSVKKGLRKYQNEYMKQMNDFGY